MIAALAVTSCGGSPPQTSPAVSVSPEVSAAAPSFFWLMTDSGALGNYNVSIDGCELCEDFQRNPAAIITFTWTNNSDVPASFMTALSAKAFQNGALCDFAVLTGDGGQNSGAFMKEIGPGATLTVQYAYSLQDAENPVEVEVTMMTFGVTPPSVTRTFELGQ